MLTKEMKIIVENYCERTGCSLPEAARAIGIHRSTMYEWFKREPQSKVNRRFIRYIRKLELVD